MLRLLSLLCLVSAGVAACQTPASVAPEESLDPFSVAIDATRWGVIIDHARDGVIESGVDESGPANDDILRADAALKSGAANLIILRNDVCRRGLLAGNDCQIRCLASLDTGATIIPDVSQGAGPAQPVARGRNAALHGGRM